MPSPLRPIRGGLRAGTGARALQRNRTRKLCGGWSWSNTRLREGQQRPAAANRDYSPPHRVGVGTDPYRYLDNTARTALAGGHGSPRPTVDLISALVLPVGAVLFRTTGEACLSPTDTGGGDATSRDRCVAAETGNIICAVSEP